MKDKKIIIAFAGRKGHGKDYCAHLARTLMYDDSTRTSFADPIKSLAASMFGWDGRKDKKGRRFLQLLGTEVGRCYHDRIWLDKALAGIREAKTEVVFNTDLRFGLEVEGLSELKKDGHTVFFIHVNKLDRGQWWTNLVHRFRCAVGLEHSSERGLPQETFDFFITNDFGYPERTIQQVRDILMFCGVTDVREECTF